MSPVKKNTRAIEISFLKKSIGAAGADKKF
jgi:hypothetical protein